MNYFSWVQQERTLSNLALTVRAQATEPGDVDNMVHDVFFPRRDVNSTRLREVGSVDFRPISERREWNARGRQINTIIPNESELSFIPIESYFNVGEEEIQRLTEVLNGDEAAFRNSIRMNIPQRIDDLAQANIRRMEMDAFRAWAKGEIEVRHPHTGALTTVSYGFDTDRYQTAGTALDDASVNAYEEFLAWVADGVDAMNGGSAAGVVLTRAIFRAIQADAPTGLDGQPLTRAAFIERLRDDTGLDLTFYTLDHKGDRYTDGGMATTRQRYWPDEQMALVPTGVAVGNMCYAPVARAHEIARSATAGGQEIDVRGQTCYVEIAGNGRQATWEVQVNSFPVPREDNIWVMDTGVVTP